ncbi:hypothetical protein MLD38_033371 [Melastoma candidum]|uniref:Uncharacterized protein n=1 Tax=Melastoma candidum TaxID=119954 RepID=A0ACB9M8M2_9MYRT|nr:hypothetical protein MLD38_033371 [Melastoma candidum]
MSRGYTSAGPMATFYVFPCGPSFHVQCLIAHVTRCKTETQAGYILDLQKQRTLPGSQARRDQNGGINDEPVTSTTSAEKLRQQLDDAIAGECPFCGELMIREITLPFILPKEAQEVTSWEIKPTLAKLRSVSLPI